MNECYIKEDKLMQCMERFKEFRDDDFDGIIMKIATGKIKTGKYSNRIKIDKNFKMNKKELFSNGKNDKDQ